MTDTIQLLKFLKNQNNSNEFHNVEKILHQLNYKTDSAKSEFLQKLRNKDFIQFQESGSQPQIYKVNEYNEPTGLKDEAKPIKFSAKLIEAGDEHLEEYLSKKKAGRKSTWALIISGIVGTATIISVAYNIYQSQTIKEKDEQIKKMETQTDSLLTKLSQQDSLMTEITRQSSKDIRLNILQGKTNNHQ